ncbi:MAG: FG-GAP-like repeat-containing protein [bacterium]
MLVRVPAARLGTGAALVLLVPALALAQNFTRIDTGDPFTGPTDSRSVNWADIDGDGDLDLFVSNAGPGGQPNELYRNDAGTLTAIVGDPVTMDGLRDVGAAFGDVDNDGDPDLYSSSWYGQVNGQWQNQGDGSFVRVTTGPQVTTGTHTEDVAWVDVDNDGDLDLFVANAGNDAASAEDDILYLNDGAGNLTAIAGDPLVTDGLLSRHGAFADYDDDGDLDVFVAMEAGQDNRLYRNLLTETGSLAFEIVTTAGSLTSDGGQSFSASWGDFDNDDDLDLIVGNMDAEENFLYVNQLTETGTATFVRILDQDPATQRGYTVGTTWADWDNDGDLDLLLANAFAMSPNRPRKNFLYRNDGGVLLRMNDSPVATDEGWTFGASWADWDEDGDLDLFTARCYANSEVNALYRNEAQLDGRHWLGVRCAGTVSNRSAVGAVVRVTATIRGQIVSQRRDVASSDGYSSGNFDQHFGLDDATTVSEIEVTWPSGIVQTLTNVPADQRLTITEPLSTGALEPGLGESWLRATPNPFRDSVRFAGLDLGESELQIVDVAGRSVRSLAGPEWDGRDEGGREVAPGVYFVRARAREDGTSSVTPIVRLR